MNTIEAAKYLAVCVDLEKTQAELERAQKELEQCKQLIASVQFQREMLGMLGDSKVETELTKHKAVVERVRQELEVAATGADGTILRILDRCLAPLEGE